MRLIIYDMEIYPNHTCLTYVTKDNEIQILEEVEEISKLKLNRYMWLGFNTRRYDQLILNAIVNDRKTQQEIYELSVSLIHDDGESRYCFDENVIDLYEVCPKFARTSLKEFGHRFRYPHLENLPYPFDRNLSDLEWGEVKEYSKHDVKITMLLWEILKKEQEGRQALAERYRINMLGGMPAFAQRIILSSMSENASVAGYGVEIKKPKDLILSPCSEEICNEIYEHDYGDALKILPDLKKFDDKTVDAIVSRIPKLAKVMPSVLKEPYFIGELKIKFGVGGLHGFDRAGIFRDIYDYDVTSYYPSIILKNELGSSDFRRVYETMYNERLKAKKEGKLDYQKLVINATFGKLNDKYARPRMRAPHIALNICLDGQMYLIDLIEKCEGCDVIMANTDGIFTRKPIPKEILDEWTERTKLKLTAAKISLLILKDVNSYYAEYEGGKVKRKKEFLENVWTHNVKAPVIARSVISYIKEAIPIEETIRASTDPFDFCMFSKAKKGGVIFWGEEELDDPKVRWYVSIEGAILRRVYATSDVSILKNWNTCLAMDIHEFDWDNLNYEYYVEQAMKLLSKVNV